MDKYRIPSEYENLWKDLRTASDNYDYDAVIGLLDNRQWGKNNERKKNGEFCNSPCVLCLYWTDCREYIDQMGILGTASDHHWNDPFMGDESLRKTGLQYQEDGLFYLCHACSLFSWSS